jgi:hypothetical protein
MVLAGGSSREALEVELLGFEGVGWGGGFDFGDEVGDFTLYLPDAPLTSSFSLIRWYTLSITAMFLSSSACFSFILSPGQFVFEFQFRPGVVVYWFEVGGGF